MNAWRAFVFFGLISAVAGIGLAGSIVGVRMVNAVNCKLPAEAQFEMWGWYFGKSVRLREGYKRLYPSGTLLRQSRMLQAAMLLCGGGAAALLFQWV